MKETSILSERAVRFGSIFASILVVTLLHRYYGLTKFIDRSYVWTYNPYDGFDPVAAFFEEKAHSLWLGIANDILFSGAFALIFAFLPVALLIVAILVLALFYSSNIEHIHTNLTAIDLDLLGFATDPTFVNAHFTPSVVENWVIFSLIAIALLATARLPLLSKSCAAAGVVLCCAALVFVPNNFRINELRWIQSHPLLPTLGHAKLEASDRNFEPSVFQREAVIELGPDQLNVLVIYLEGLSNFSLTMADMDVLNRLATDNIRLDRFVGPQLITSNGLYTTLTGDLPSFVSSERKWNDLTADSEVAEVSLPAVLASAGFHTAFLQSANLAFMSKDQHLKDLGFEVLRGDADWAAGPGVLRNGWGIDDRSLFRNVVDYIDNLSTDEPWFIAALTTGTHAPYNVPDDFLPDVPSARLRSLKYADQAVGELMEALEQRGILENTVVVFTSDESRETANLPQLENEILLNWLPFIAVHPSGSKQSVEKIVSSKDTRNIILELATNATRPDLQQLIEESEPVIFGNILSGRIFWYDPGRKEMFACLAGRELGCEHWQDVVDFTQPSNGTLAGQAYFSQLKTVILDHE